MLLKKVVAWPNAGMWKCSENVGNMMQSVVLDGNPLNEDEDMRLLTCVVLDDKPPDEVILDLMDLVNNVNLMFVDNMMLSVVLEKQPT